MDLKIGIDLVAVETIEMAIRAHSSDYVDRIYTAREQRECRAPGGGLDPARLAGRFAVKEAVLKVLREADEAIPWTSIDVASDGDGGASVELSGVASDLARQRGVDRFEVSITQEGPFAAAVVLARTESR
jgi:holo-[acyl-carrier protein] synthase